MIRELQKLPAVVMFVSPRGPVSNVKVLGFSDASFNILAGNAYGQSGIIAGLFIETEEHAVFHLLDPHSSKQRMVVYFSFRAETLACADADKRLLGLKIGLSNMLGRSLESELLVDSKGLYTCITTLSDQREYRLRRTVTRIRESFDSQELDVLRWIAGLLNLVDGSTKWNPQTLKLVLSVLSTGLMAERIITGPTRGEGPSWRRNLPSTPRREYRSSDR